MFPNGDTHISDAIRKLNESGEDERFGYCCEVLELLGVVSCRSSSSSELEKFSRSVDERTIKPLVDSFAEEVACFKEACIDLESQSSDFFEMLDFDFEAAPFEEGEDDLDFEDDASDFEDVDACAEIVYERQRLEFMSQGIAALKTTAGFDSVFEDDVNQIHQELQDLDQSLSSEESLRRLNCVIGLPLIRNLRLLSQWRNNSEDKCWWLDSSLETSASDELKWLVKARKRIKFLFAESIILPIKKNEEEVWSCAALGDEEDERFLIEEEKFQISLEDGWCQGDWSDYVPLGIVAFEKSQSDGFRLKFSIELPVGGFGHELPPPPGPLEEKLVPALAASSEDKKDFQPSAKDWGWSYFADWISIHRQVNLEESRVEIAVESKRRISFGWRAETESSSIGTVSKIDEGEVSCLAVSRGEEHDYPYRANFSFEYSEDLQQIWVSIFQKNRHHELPLDFINMLDFHPIKDSERAIQNFEPCIEPKLDIGFLCFKRGIDIGDDEHLRYLHYLFIRNQTFLEGFLAKKYASLSRDERSDIIQEAMLKVTQDIRRVGTIEYVHSKFLDFKSKENTSKLEGLTPSQREEIILICERGFLRKTVENKALDFFRAQKAEKRRLLVTYTDLGFETNEELGQFEDSGLEEIEIEEEEVVEVVEAAADATTAADNLKIVEGIGPKIEELLHNAGLKTYTQLSEASADSIKEILAAAGNRYKMHDPTTWPKQAEMAAAGKFDELKVWQDELQGGKA